MSCPVSGPCKAAAALVRAVQRQLILGSDNPTKPLAKAVGPHHRQAYGSHMLQGAQRLQSDRT